MNALEAQVALMRAGIVPILPRHKRSQGRVVAPGTWAVSHSLPHAHRVAEAAHSARGWSRRPEREQNKKRG